MGEEAASPTGTGTREEGSPAHGPGEASSAPEDIEEGWWWDIFGERPHEIARGLVAPTMERASLGEFAISASMEEQVIPLICASMTIAGLTIEVQPELVTTAEVVDPPLHALLEKRVDPIEDVAPTEVGISAIARL